MKIKVVFDTDAATDDIIAALYLLHHPEVSLEAITICGTGEAHAFQGAKNMRALCDELDRNEIPIAFGSETPISSHPDPFPSWLREGVDSVWSELMDLSTFEPKLYHAPAVTLMKETLEKNDKIVILATGPLTNVAELLSKYPDCVHKIEKIVIMGGAIDIPGNISNLKPDTHNQTAEWNIYADPKAADIVLQSSVPIVLVPLNATNQVRITPQFYKELSYYDDIPHKIIYSLFKNLIKVLGDDLFFSKFCLWDPFAAMICVNSCYVELQSMICDVNTTEDLNQAGTIMRRITAGKDDEAMINVRLKVAMRLQCNPQQILDDLMCIIGSPIPGRSKQYSSTYHHLMFWKTGTTVSTPAVESSYNYV